MPQAPLHPVPDDGYPHGLGYDETGTRLARRFAADLRGHQVNHDHAAAGTPAPANRRGKLTVAAEPLGRGQHPIP
jgi:hypothetical protein